MLRRAATRMTPCKPPARKFNPFSPKAVLRKRRTAFPYVLCMEEQAIILAIQKLMESGAFEKLDQPGAQSFIIYALLIVLAMFSFRLFVINGSVKRFFELEEKKVQLLHDLNTKVLDVQTSVNKEHEKLGDVLRLLGNRRHPELE